MGEDACIDPGCVEAAATARWTRKQPPESRCGNRYEQHSARPPDRARPSDGVFQETWAPCVWAVWAGWAALAGLRPLGLAQAQGEGRAGKVEGGHRRALTCEYLSLPRADAGPLFFERLCIREGTRHGLLAIRRIIHGYLAFLPLFGSLTAISGRSCRTASHAHVRWIRWRAPIGARRHARTRRLKLAPGRPRTPLDIPSEHVRCPGVAQLRPRKRLPGLPGSLPTAVAAPHTSAALPRILQSLFVAYRLAPLPAASPTHASPQLLRRPAEAPGDASGDVEMHGAPCRCDRPQSEAIRAVTPRVICV